MHGLLLWSFMQMYMAGSGRNDKAVCNTCFISWLTSSITCSSRIGDLMILGMSILLLVISR